MRRRSLLTVGVSACLLLTAGCSTAPATVPLPSTDKQSAIALPSSPGTAPALMPQDELPEPTLGTAPSWGPTDQAAAGDAARVAVTAYISDRAQEAWWSELARLLSPTAQQAYAGTDPANVPGRTLTGPPTVTDGAGSAYLADVVIPTDAGDYGVLLSRSAGGDRWLVERFWLPEPTGTP